MIKEFFACNVVPMSNALYRLDIITEYTILILYLLSILDLIFYV